LFTAINRKVAVKEEFEAFGAKGHTSKKGINRYWLTPLYVW
jgi:hypothetical protein